MNQTKTNESDVSFGHRKKYSVDFGEEELIDDEIEDNPYATITSHTKRLKSVKHQVTNRLKQVSQVLEWAIEELNIDLGKKPMDSGDLEKIGKWIGVAMSPFQVFEALYFSRQYSKEASKFKLELLANWFTRNLPLMRTTNPDSLLKSILNNSSSQFFQ